MATELIQSDPSTMMGKPVVAGMLIPVELILEKLAAGEMIDQLLEAHPRLSKEGILAAMSSAASARCFDVVRDNRNAPWTSRQGA